jgi:hypothetical protein
MKNTFKIIGIVFITFSILTISAVYVATKHNCIDATHQNCDYNCPCDGLECK